MKDGPKIIPFLSLLTILLTAAHQEPLALRTGREVERLARQDSLWPGYQPLAIPLAIYDGTHTYLFRHPAPPPGFRILEGVSPTVHVMDGRHDAVTSNSSAEIGGVPTATVLADGARAQQSPAELAAVALHEAYHVFQRKQHPSWSANEADFMQYPIANAQLLALRRLESAALRRALAGTDPGQSACWTGRALTYRRQRFARLDSVFVSYERLSEMNEGLATYVQLRALGRTTVDMPANEFAPAEVRLRAYSSGPAWALLLDRFVPGWQRALERDDSESLDEILSAGLQPAGASCAFSPADIAGQEQAARRDSVALHSGWAERERAFDSRPGWRVVVEAAAGQPLWPQGFDPLNLERLPRGLLHTRWLRLGNDGGRLNAIDEANIDLEAITEAAGAHPLFNGVRRVTIAGLPRPNIERTGTRIVLNGPGLTIDFEHATVRETDRAILIRLQPRS